MKKNLLFLVSVIKGDGHSGLGDSSLTVLVHQLLQVGRPDVGEVGDSQQEADGIQYVTFTRPTIIRLDGNLKQKWYITH